MSREKPWSLLCPRVSVKDSHRGCQEHLELRDQFKVKEKMAYKGQTEVEDEMKIQNLHPGRARVDCSTLLGIREMQSKVTVRYHVTSSSLTIIFYKWKITIGEDVENSEPFYIAGC